jgi:hypothetical protein
VWWEMLSMLKRFLVSGCIVLFREAAIVQSTLMLVTILAFLCLTVGVRPFYNRLISTLCILGEVWNRLSTRARAHTHPRTHPRTRTPTRTHERTRVHDAHDMLRTEKRTHARAAQRRGRICAAAHTRTATRPRAPRMVRARSDAQTLRYPAARGCAALHVPVTVLPVRSTERGSSRIRRRACRLGC